jgi:hypothetical protein
MFGVRIAPAGKQTKIDPSINLNSMAKYFDIRMSKVDLVCGIEKNRTTIPLVQCTKDHWINSPDISSMFKEMNIQNWLCPPLNVSLPIKGNSYSRKGIYLDIAAYPCKNTSTVLCETP